MPVNLSVSGKVWKILPEVEPEQSLVEAAGGSVLLARLLMQRGLGTAEEASVFLSPRSYQPTSPMVFGDMAKAIMRIARAIAEGEQITVYGDYDVDGVTGTAVLITVLRELGARVDFYIPHRTSEGYGLNLKAVSILASKHRTKLIITCDCGIANFAEINFARSLGVDTIIVDHHSMPDMLPPAAAILHPKLLADDHPLYHLPGVGMAYKLCEALLSDRGLADRADDLLDFVTLGMIADMVPLVRENRYLVQVGLPRLVASRRPGIQALIGQCGNNGGTDIVGFGLAPRINAAGRLSDANQAVELMTTDDSAVAERLARQLELENARRQELCERIMYEAEQMVSASRNPKEDGAIVIAREGWHHGVVGIVASRLVEKFHCPVFIAEIDGELVKGSARGVEGIDLYQVLRANEHLLARWGGHKMAAGFSLERGRWDEFRQAIEHTCRGMLGPGSANPQLTVESVLPAKAVTAGLASEILRLAPFGMANKKPVFMIEAVRCLSSRPLGKEGKHARIMVESVDGLAFECVYWRSQGRIPADGQVIDLAFTPELNAYNGRERLQLVLADWRDPAGGELAEALSGALGRPENKAQVEGEPAGALAQEAGAGGVPSAQAASGMAAAACPAPEPAQSARIASVTSFAVSWKDLRGMGEPLSVLEAARRNLGDRLAIFIEGAGAPAGFNCVDRQTVFGVKHLIIWQYPPSLRSFQQIIHAAQPRSVYLVGGTPTIADEPGAFLKRLMGLMRFAAKHKEGKVEGERVAAALASTKMAVALGLSILRKLSVIDWFSEDGYIYLDILGPECGRADELPEFRQLAGALAEVQEFRQWCAASPVKEIQLALTPNHVALAPLGGAAADGPGPFRGGSAIDVQREEPVG